MEESQNEVLAEFKAVCRRIGWKATAPRFAVYRYLRGNMGHPNVDSVWTAAREALPDITRESVYRILNDFASQGLVAVLDRADVVARFDSDVSRHDHFYCDRCGKIVDFKIEGLERIAGPALERLGVVLRLEARARGICRECLEKERRENR